MFALPPLAARDTATAQSTGRSSTPLFRYDLDTAARFGIDQPARLRGESTFSDGSVTARSIFHGRGRPGSAAAMLRGSRRCCRRGQMCATSRCFHRPTANWHRDSARSLVITSEESVTVCCTAAARAFRIRRDELPRPFSVLVADKVRRRKRHPGTCASNTRSATRTPSATNTPAWASRSRNL